MEKVIEKSLIEWEDDKWIILKTGPAMDRLFRESMYSNLNKFGRLAYRGDEDEKNIINLSLASIANADIRSEFSTEVR